MGVEMSYPSMGMSEQTQPGAPLHTPAWVSSPVPFAAGLTSVMPFFGGAHTSYEVMPVTVASAATGNPVGAGHDFEQRPRHRYSMAEPMGAGAREF
mmetsp:Transcript_32166/g.87184  ORF Transcript_32166/g.87184 Transcript_32166/m.87184 type:complete len:96 (+) Transcript_32166:121-408(+)